MAQWLPGVWGRERRVGRARRIFRAVRWLILCVNLTSIRDAHIADKTLFLGVSVRVSPEEISI